LFELQFCDLIKHPIKQLNHHIGQISPHAHNLTKKKFIELLEEQRKQLAIIMFSKSSW